MKTLLVTLLFFFLFASAQGQKPGTVIDNLTTTKTGYALDASRGKELMDSMKILAESIKKLRKEIDSTISLRNAEGSGISTLSVLSPTEGKFKLWEFVGAKVDTTPDKITVTIIYPKATGGSALKEDVEPIPTSPGLSFSGNVKEALTGSKVWKYGAGNGGGVSTRLFVPGIASSFEFTYKTGDKNVGIGLDTSATPLPLAGQAFSVYVTADEKGFIATDPKFLNYSVSPTPPVNNDTTGVQVTTDGTLSAFVKKGGVKTVFHTWKDKLKVPMRLHISVAFDSTGLSALRNPTFN